MIGPSKRDQEFGQTLVYVAIAMVVLLAIASLAIDVGNTYTERRRMQNAADAGALAGAQALCLGTPEAGARQAALNYAHSNGAPNASAYLDMTKFWVTVNVSTTADLFLAPVIGVADPNVPAVAQAACGDTPTGCGLWPIAFDIKQWFSLQDKGYCSSEMPDMYVWTGEQQDKTKEGDPTPTPMPEGKVCDICDCDPNRDGVNEVFTDVSRGWLDFSGNTDPLYPDACTKPGCSAEELKCLIRSGEAARITVPSCITGDNGVRAALQKPVEARAGANVKIPLFDGNECTSPPPDAACSSGVPYWVTDFGCVKVVGWEQKLTLYFKGDTEKKGKACLKDKFIHVTMNCDLGACETGCGNASGAPTPGSVNSVSLIK